MFTRPAISCSAEATSSAWARLSSWQGPAIIEIGKSLPNLTDPAATTGAAEMLSFKGTFLFRGDPEVPRPRDQPYLEGSNTRFAPGGIKKAACLLHRRECGRHQQLVDNVADDLAVGFGFRARLDPFRIRLKRRPFLLALGERFPGQQIRQLLIGLAD